MHTIILLLPRFDDEFGKLLFSWRDRSSHEVMNHMRALFLSFHRKIINLAL